MESQEADWCFVQKKKEKKEKTEKKATEPVLAATTEALSTKKKENVSAGEFIRPLSSQANPGKAHAVLKIPASSMGHVIGKKGHAISAVREQVAFAELHDTSSGGQLELVGSASDVAVAAKIAASKIKLGVAPQLVWTAEVSNSIAGRIIGKQGSNISYLQNMPGAVTVKLCRIDDLTSMLELGAASEASMKKLVVQANKFAGMPLPFHGRGGKIDRLIKPQSSSRMVGKSLHTLYRPHQVGEADWVRAPKDEYDMCDDWNYPYDDFEWQNECYEDEEHDWQEENDAVLRMLYPNFKFMTAEPAFSAVATISKLLVGRVIGQKGSRINELRALEGMGKVELTETDGGHVLKFSASSMEPIRQGIDMAKEFVGVPISFKVSKPAPEAPKAPSTGFKNTFNDPPLPSKKK